jgi:hypothetical protein
MRIMGMKIEANVRWTATAGDRPPPVRHMPPMHRTDKTTYSATAIPPLDLWIILRIFPLGALGVPRRWSIEKKATHAIARKSVLRRNLISAIAIIHQPI